MSSGFLYVLIDRTKPQVAKVGGLKYDPEEAPPSNADSQFILAYKRPVRDVQEAEQRLRAELFRAGFAVERGAEIFTGPLHRIVASIEAASRGSEMPPYETLGEPFLIALAEDYEYGRGTPVDVSKARAIYEYVARTRNAGDCVETPKFTHSQTTPFAR